MKIDRLLGIVNILLTTDKTTATALSRHFEVSRRTILRDIDTLSAAGVPILTEAGYGGGISLMTGYKLDKTFLSPQEVSEILLGLQALQSIDKSSSYQGLANRFGAEPSAYKHIHIDLSSYYKRDIVDKFAIIEQAIEHKQYVTFTYHNIAGTSRRKVKPYTIVFQWGSWYLWAFCEYKQDVRLFKLSRMTRLVATGDTFDTPVPVYQKSVDDYYTGDTYSVCLWFNHSAKWRVVDEYGFSYIEEQPDGFYFRFSFDNKAYLLQWILSFGSDVTVLEPPEIRTAVVRQHQKALAQYGE